MFVVCCMLVLAGPFGFEFENLGPKYPPRPSHHVLVDTELLFVTTPRAAEQKSREQRAAALRNDRWLSKREKGEKIIELLGRDAPRTSFRGLVDRERVVVSWKGTRVICRSALVGEGGYGCVVFRSDEFSFEEVIDVWLLPASPPMSPLDDPFFAPTLEQSLTIRSSDLPASEKGRQLAKLVQPWMSYEQVHALFGESKVVVHEPFSREPKARIALADYGVVLQGGKRGGLEAHSFPVGEFGLAVWECLARFDQLREAQERERPTPKYHWSCWGACHSIY